MFYVYVLKSLKDEDLYIGSSNNLKRRLSEHQNGKSFSTQFRRPFELVYYEAYKNEESAKIRERKLKQFGSAYKGLIKRLNLKGV